MYWPPVKTLSRLVSPVFECHRPVVEGQQNLCPGAILCRHAQCSLDVHASRKSVVSLKQVNSRPTISPGSESRFDTSSLMSIEQSASIQFTQAVSVSILV